MSKTEISSSVNSTMRFLREKNIFFSSTYREVQQKAELIWKFQYYHLVKDHQRRPPSIILQLYNTLFLPAFFFSLRIRNHPLRLSEDDTTTERPVKGRPLLFQNNVFSIFSFFFLHLWKILQTQSLGGFR